MRRILWSLTIVGILLVTGAASAGAIGGPEVTGDRSAQLMSRESASLPSARPLATPEEPLRVLLMGDSLAWEAQGPFAQVITAEGRAEVETMVYGGTALCDWLPRLEAELGAFRPDAAVVEFSGNLLTPCMIDPTTGVAYAGSAYPAKYRADATAAMELFTRYDVSVYWANAPIGRGATHPSPIPGVYAELARTWPNAHYVDAAAAVLDHGTYTDYLPCLPVDPCTDVDAATGRPAAIVRAPDGGHFCPGAPAAQRGVTDACPVWSSGAWRYGSAMADPVVGDYRL